MRRATQRFSRALPRRKSSLAAASWWSSRHARPERTRATLARAATSEAASLKVRERLLQLLARIHHERTVAGGRLVQRASGHEDGARRTAVASRRDAGGPHLCALARHGELMGT